MNEESTIKKRKIDDVDPPDGVTDADRESIDTFYKSRVADIAALKERRAEFVKKTTAAATEIKAKLTQLSEELNEVIKLDSDIQKQVDTELLTWNNRRFVPADAELRSKIRKRFMLADFYSERLPVTLDTTSHFEPFSIRIDDNAVTITPQLLHVLRITKVVDCNRDGRDIQVARARRYANRKLASVNKKAYQVNGRKRDDNHEWLDELQRQVYVVEAAQRELGSTVARHKSNTN